MSEFNESTRVALRTMFAGIVIVVCAFCVCITAAAISRALGTREVLAGMIGGALGVWIASWLQHIAASWVRPHA